MERENREPGCWQIKVYKAGGEVEEYSYEGKEDEGNEPEKNSEE